MFFRSSVTVLAALGALLGASACSKDEPLVEPSNCAGELVETGAGANGSGLVFNGDPAIASGNPNLSPSALNLDDFRSQVSLARLGGRGVLEGTYVDVRSGLCLGSFGAQEPAQSFQYAHADPRFQEVMSYYFGDLFRSRLDQAGYLLPAAPLKIVAHCMKADNAYFSRGVDLATGQYVKKVCLGDSKATPGASYADDALVAVHEMQHGATIDAYSLTQDLGSFWYDEAGAINEAISDFMALMLFSPLTPSALDSRIFSRWALGQFIPGFSGARGTHRCPAYDRQYPGCAGFRSGLDGFSADAGTVSYFYPDGLGWPFANNYSGPSPMKSAFEGYSAHEEIHNNASIVSGALWDMYEALRANHGGDALTAQLLSTQAVMEAVTHLPKPSAAHLSPVTFWELASNVVSAAQLLGFSTVDQQSVERALTARGIYGGGDALGADWAARGDGVIGITDGVKVMDNPVRLKEWFGRIAGDISPVTHGPETGLNNKLDPGEVAAIWFDVKNISTLGATAGGVQLTVTSLDPDITFLNSNYNFGSVGSDRAQIQYSKIHGTGIVARLASTNGSYHIDTSNSYFRTNRFFAETWMTALFVRVAASAAHGKSVTLRVDLAPANGSVDSVDFPVAIQ